MENTFIDDTNYSNFNWRDLFPITKAKDVIVNTTTIGQLNERFIDPRRVNKNNAIIGKSSFLSKTMIASILEAYRQKQKRKQEIEATLQVTKSQEAYNELQKELIALKKQMASMQSDLLKKSSLSTQATQKLVTQIEENPDIEVSKQLETIPEIPNEVVDSQKQDEKKVEEIKSDNGASTNKWVKPALIVGGIALAYYFFVKKK
jgi:tellurite resistance protein